MECLPGDVGAPAELALVFVGFGLVHLNGLPGGRLVAHVDAPEDDTVLQPAPHVKEVDDVEHLLRAERAGAIGGERLGLDDLLRGRVEVTRELRLTRPDARVVAELVADDEFNEVLCDVLWGIGEAELDARGADQLEILKGIGLVTSIASTKNVLGIFVSSGHNTLYKFLGLELKLDAGQELGGHCGYVGLEGLVAVLYTKHVARIQIF